MAQRRHRWDHGADHLRVDRSSDSFPEARDLDDYLTDAEKERVKQLMEPSGFGDSWAKASAMGEIYRRAMQRRHSDARMVRQTLDDMAFYRTILTWEEIKRAI